MEERWLPLVGYEAAYQVSNQGRVRSVDREITTSNGAVRRLRGRTLKPCPTPGGYPQVTVSQNGRLHAMPIHTAVLTAFDRPRPQGLEARHLNGIQTDNRLVNLAWGTHQENMADRLQHGSHHNSLKTHCPHGHEYSEANNIRFVQKQGRGWRACLACARATTKVRRAAAKGVTLDFQAVSDAEYAKIAG